MANHSILTTLQRGKKASGTRVMCDMTLSVEWLDTNDTCQWHSYITSTFILSARKQETLKPTGYNHVNYSKNVFIFGCAVQCSSSVDIVSQSFLLFASFTILAVSLSRVTTLGFLNTQLFAIDVQVGQCSQCILHQLAVFKLQEGVTVATMPDDTQRVNIFTTNFRFEGADTQGPWQSTNKQGWLTTTSWSEPTVKTYSTLNTSNAVV